MSYWTDNPDADDRLREMWNAGYSIPLIADRLGTPEEATWKRKAHLGLKPRKVIHTKAAPRDKPWTKEQKQVLKKAWLAGYSVNGCRGLVEPFRPGVTRNGIVGQARRMGLPGRPSPIRQKGRARQMEQTKHGCEWPFNDPGTPEYHECGKEPVKHQPYCAEHMLASVRPEYRPSLRKALRAA